MVERCKCCGGRPIKSCEDCFKKTSGNIELEARKDIYVDGEEMLVWLRTNYKCGNVLAFYPDDLPHIIELCQELAIVLGESSG